MGIVFATVAAIILCIVLVYICFEKDFECLGGTAIVFGVLFGFILIIELSAVGLEFVTKDAHEAAYEQRYEALLYQFEEDIYRYELNGEGKRDLYREIEAWNSDLAKHQVYQHSFWTNWFYLVDYDQFEFIELPKSVG